jgi:hypothetical protein
LRLNLPSDAWAKTRLSPGYCPSGIVRPVRLDPEISPACAADTRYQAAKSLILLRFLSARSSI